MSQSLVFVLGASDPEMSAIESLLLDAGVRFCYAVTSGVRVHPGNAYKADGVEPPLSVSEEDTIVFVECDLPGWFSGDPQPRVMRCDHHRPGDPGYGLPPEQFLEGSSIGQVLSLLADSGVAFWASPTTSDSWDPGWFNLDHVCLIEDHDLLLIAAADHCLEAAYRGRCPGVDPDDLMEFRAKSRAEFQRRPWVCARCGQARDESDHGRLYNLSVDDAGSIGGQGSCGDHHVWMSPVDSLMADIEAARNRLLQAIGDPRIDPAVSVCIRDGIRIADLRGENIPELPEAAAREGIPFLSTVKDRDGREKVVLMAAPPELVRLFLAGEIVTGLTGMYGDPARGFAGGYLS